MANKIHTYRARVNKDGSITFYSKGRKIDKFNRLAHAKAFEQGLKKYGTARVTWDYEPYSQAIIARRKAEEVSK